jgi:hypothetical protein
MTRPLALILFLFALAAPLAARDSLGVYEGWAAFKDARPLRCYAIAKAQGAKAGRAYATVSHWPERGLRGAVHLVLSRDVAAGGKVRLAVGEKRFALVAKGGNAWARDARDDAAIVAAMRSAARMSVSANAAKGGGFTDRYALAGAATAIDAATVACAQRR